MNSLENAHLIIQVLFFLFALYAAYHNILNKKITRYGLDFWLLKLGSLVIGKIDVDTRSISPKNVTRGGIAMLLIAFGAFLEIARILF